MLFISFLLACLISFHPIFFLSYQSCYNIYFAGYTFSVFFFFFPACVYMVSCIQVHLGFSLSNSGCLRVHKVYLLVQNVSTLWWFYLWTWTSNGDSIEYSGSVIFFCKKKKLKEKEIDSFSSCKWSEIGCYAPQTWFFTKRRSKGQSFKEVCSFSL